MSTKDPVSDELPQPLPEVLILAAQREQARPTRSRLEPWAKVIFILRDKRWAFAAITDWLAQNGVRAAASTVQRFYRNREREGSNGPATPSAGTNQSGISLSSPHENSQTRPGRSSTQPANKPKFNTNF